MNAIDRGIAEHALPAAFAPRHSSLVLAVVLAGCAQGGLGGASSSTGDVASSTGGVTSSGGIGGIASGGMGGVSSGGNVGASSAGGRSGASGGTTSQDGGPDTGQDGGTADGDILDRLAIVQGSCHLAHNPALTDLRILQPPAAYGSSEQHPSIS